MKRFDLAYPCRADFGAMPIAAGGRFCADCGKVVHDLSAMTEAEARGLLARTPADRVCVRYVYDADSGDVVFGSRAADRAALVPEHRLLQRLKSRVALAAALAAPLLVEACGGNDGNYRQGQKEAGLEQGFSGEDPGEDAPDAADLDAPADTDAGTED
jgi:hypothetical protein